MYVDINTNGRNPVSDTEYEVRGFAADPRKRNQLPPIRRNGATMPVSQQLGNCLQVARLCPVEAGRVDELGNTLSFQVGERFRIWSNAQQALAGGKRYFISGAEADKRSNKDTEGIRVASRKNIHGRCLG